MVLHQIVFDEAFMHLIKDLAELIDSYPHFFPQILHFDDIRSYLANFIFKILLQSLYLIMQYFGIVLHLHGALYMLSLCLLYLPYRILNFLRNSMHIH